MEFRSLFRLESLGVLEPKATPGEMVTGWLTRSREDVRLVRDVLAYEHMERAVGIAYEAGYRACAGVVALSGYRIRSVPGHHRAGIEAAGAVPPRGSRLQHDCRDGDRPPRWPDLSGQVSLGP